MSGGVCDGGSMHGGRHKWQDLCVVGGVHGRGMHARETTSEAGGTHPTGIHSCSN